jgi:hypothetical protein
VDAIASLKPLLSARGILVAAIRAPQGSSLGALAGEAPPAGEEAPPYEPFAEVLAASFPVVEVATQSPAVGYVIAAGAAEAEPDVTVDGSLAGGTAAAFYVFFCGFEPTGLAGLTLVALPPAELWDEARALADVARAHASCPDPFRVAAERDGLSRELAERDARLAAREADLEGVLARLRERDADLAEARAQLRDAEERLREAGARADELAAAASAREAEWQGIRAALVADRERADAAHAEGRERMRAELESER